MFRQTLATIGLAFLLAQSAAAADAPANSQAEWHRVMADLIEAKAANPPDQAKIERLTKRVGELSVESRGGAVG